MEYLDKILKSLVNGNSPNDWLIMKFIIASVGGLCAYFFKHYSSTAGETKIRFWWKGFWFTIISSFGGVFILAPQTAFNAFIAGLLGWSAIANVLKQKNEGASNEQFSEHVLTKEQIQEQKNRGNNNDRERQ